VELVARKIHKGAGEGHVKPGEGRPLPCTPWPEGSSSCATSPGPSLRALTSLGTSSRHQTRLRGCHCRAVRTLDRESPPRESSLGQPPCRLALAGIRIHGEAGGRCRTVAGGPRQDPPRVSLVASLGSASMGRSGAAAARVQLALTEILPGSRRRPPWDPPPSPSRKNMGERR
jgi:hypothetical protein